jgi:hypothetical protein
LILKIFRKVRQLLLSENRVRNYLLYAIGEIILVVIGILIAVSINNNSEYRKAREKEQIILKQLQSEFKSNLAQLDQKISIRKKMMASSLRLLGYIDDPSSAIRDSVDLHISNSMSYTTFDPIINDLASSGNLRLIINDSLKQKLSAWTYEVVQVKENEDQWFSYRNNIYLPFLVEHYQLRSMRKKAMEKQVLDKYMMGGEPPEDTIDIGLTKHPADFMAVLEHPDFEDHLIRCYSINRFNNIQSQILRERILEILDILDREIE